MTEFKPVGFVRSIFSEPADPIEMRKQESTIVMNPEMEEGLYDIESSEFIDVIFQFHKSETYELRIINYYNEDKGVFASRSPRRPNNIGVTTVRLLERKGCELKVTGLDAINGTPVIDIKPANVSFYKDHFNEIATGELQQNPRKDILKAIKTNDLECLLLEAGKIHGHFCPGLAMGVKAATYAMQKIREMSDGMEDLIAITETNNCASDGVQFVTGCSFGNNALIFKDWGKTAFSLTTRSGRGIRIMAKNSSREYMQAKNSAFFEQFKKVVIEKSHNQEEKSKLRIEGTKASFNVLQMDFDKIFKTEEVTVQLPEYAPIHESIICGKCGESTVATRIDKEGGQELCLSCFGKEYYYLDGHGIQFI